MRDKIERLRKKEREKERARVDCRKRGDTNSEESMPQRVITVASQW